MHKINYIMNNEHMAGRYTYYLIGIILVTYTDTIKNTNNYT